MSTRNKRKKRREEAPSNEVIASTMLAVERASKVDALLPVDFLPLQELQGSVSLANALMHPPLAELRSVKPATAELVEAFIVALYVAPAVFTRLLSGRDEHLFTEWKDTFSEIVSWTTGSDLKTSSEDILKIGNSWVVRGAMTSAEVAHMAVEAGRRRSGRPVTKQRQIALTALDAQRTSSLSWMQLARKFCACGTVEHTEKCKERLRKQVAELEAFLARLSRWRKQAESFLHGDNPT